ncbi:MFS transporter [Actinomadura rupiterrae]|uniref:MFS transporter n=1 Tax=Actinomadura rupiterrae TaxID=559627 RepID=UPI0020A3D74A|nr:MFS transporter [Actinomadura rupiterrae]MCP2335138.1 MFS family permease [Actinomadura rupiterrae]
MSLRPPAVLERRWLALLAALTAAFMDLVDVTVVNVALPRIQHDLHAGPALGQWTVSAYALGYALLLVTGGRLGDILGRRRVLLAGLAGFVAVSAAAGAAHSPGVLIAARAAQGVFAGVMVPQTLSVISVQFPPGRARARAFTLYGMLLGAAQVGGPLLGGILLHYDLAGLGWRAIFLVNVPVGLAALAGAARWMDDSRATPPPRLDPAGVVLVSAAALALTLPLVQGRERGWPLWSLLLPVAGVPALAAFAAVERRRERLGLSPLVPPSLLRRRSFSAGLLVTTALFGAVAACFIALTWGLQTGLGWSPLKVALTGAAWPAGMACTAQPTHRLGPPRARAFVRTGALVMACGVAAVAGAFAATGTDLRPWNLLPGLFCAGIGMGLALPVLANAVLADVPPDASGAASGVYNSVTQFAGVLGVAVAGIAFYGTSGQVTGPSPAARTLAVAAIALLIAAALSPLLPRKLPWAEPERTPDGRPSRFAAIRASLLRHVHPGRSR